MFFAFFVSLKTYCRTMHILNIDCQNLNKKLLRDYGKQQTFEQWGTKTTYFKKTKMLDKIDSKIYNFLMLKSNNLDFDNDGNIINVFKKSIKYDITKEKIIINIKGMGKVKKVNPSLDLEKKDSYKIIEDLINETIYNETIDFLKETLDNEADLIGFKDLYYKFYMKEKDNIPYEINVDINVNRNGAIYEAIHD